MYICVGIYVCKSEAKIDISAWWYVMARSINQLSEDIRYMVGWRKNDCLAGGIKEQRGA